MYRRGMMGFVTGSLIGATVGMMAVANMNDRDRRRAIKHTKRMLMKATNMFGMDLF